MAAVINPRPSSSIPSSLGNGRPVLLHKTEGPVGRVNGVFLLSKEEGVITISDDRSVRIVLKRDNGSFWPSVHHFMPFAPTSLYFSEESMRLIIGLVNGSLYEYSVADDMNSITELRHWCPHANYISAVFCAEEAELIISCSRDKWIVWHSLKTANRLGGYMCEAPLNAMQFDIPSKFVFLGDSKGDITLLRISGLEAQLISKLSAHTDSIASLAWDPSRQRLFSASADNLVIMWDIGGKKGKAYELNAHESKLTCLSYAANCNHLFSADEDGRFVCWDMNATRIETPKWKDNNNCQLCDSPFFWNFRAMWDRKIVGSRQHHCRTCGSAVCANCCQYTTTFPPMGFELPVRICNECHSKMEINPDSFNLTPLALINELRKDVTSMHLQESTGKMVTVGFDRMIMIWDIKQLL
uniref:FYVE-type domain-containing protein n=1 Tax=Syphacia muris TaxID=451379 RepID=A0A0N5AHN7_9BILA